MDNKAESNFLRLPIAILITQVLYVIVSLLLLFVLFKHLNIGSVFHTGVHLFVTLFIAVMIIGNVIWRLAIWRKHIITTIITIAITIIAYVVIAQLFILGSAHNSYTNYYKYIGCSELIGTTDSTVICNLQSGDTIKLDKIHGKWYSDSDIFKGWL
jgi:hypothetical protein